MSLYEYGIKKELELMPIINDFMINKYGKSIRKTKYKYDKFDFKASKLRIELKSRKVYKDRFIDTMIDSCKILKGLRRMEYKEYDIYFFFNFTDGLFYYKLKKGDDRRLRFQPLKGIDKHYIKVNELIKI